MRVNNKIAPGSIPLAEIEWGRDFTVKRWSVEAEQVFGWKQEEVLGKHPSSWPFIPDDEVEKWNQVFRNLFSGKSLRNNLVCSTYSKNNLILNCYWNNSVIFDSKGNFSTILSLVYSENNKYYINDLILDQLSDTTFDGILIHDRGKIIYTNERLCEQFGYGQGDLLGANILTLGLKEIVSDKFTNNKPVEITAYKKDYTSFPAEVLSKTIVRNDKLLQYVAIRDITERKAREMELEESEKKFKTTFDQAAVGIAHLALNGTCLRVNKKFSEILGYTGEDMIGKTFADITHPEDIEKDMHELSRMEEGEIETFSLEKRYIHKNGSTVWVDLTLSLVTDALQKEKYRIAVLQDITARKKTEEELKYRNEELDTFIYKASHDLRGPVASLLGLCNIIKKEIKDETANSYYKYVEGTVKKLESVVLNLIELTKIKEESIAISEVNFEELLEKSMNSVKHLEAYEKIKFEVAIDLKNRFYSDEKHIYSLLMNLIENSVKYSIEHNPTVQINISETADGTVCIKISDNGIGIDKKIQAKVFMMFFRGTERSNGSGLGLYIVKNAVEKLNGSIDLESETGKGTNVTIFLPNLTVIE